MPRTTVAYVVHTHTVFCRRLRFERFDPTCHAIQQMQQQVWFITLQSKGATDELNDSLGRRKESHAGFHGAKACTIPTFLCTNPQAVCVGGSKFALRAAEWANWYRWERQCGNPLKSSSVKGCFFQKQLQFGCPGRFVLYSFCSFVFFLIWM